MSKIHLEIKVDNELSRAQLEEFEGLITDQIWNIEKNLGDFDYPTSVYPRSFVKSIGIHIEFEES